MTLDDLIAIEQIRQLKARYLRAMDTKDWALLESVFAPDIALDVRGGVSDPDADLSVARIETDEVIRGREAVLAFMSRNLAPMRCAHYAHMPEITLHSPETASAIWAQHDYLYADNGDPSVLGYGYYHDRYRRIDGEWKVEATRLKRLFIKQV